jgi:solute carrier family 25 carnitine/acylcarnitine transporter 20/29
MEGFLAGNITGLSQIIMGHPLDTYKTLIQSGNTKYIKPMDLLKGIKFPLYASCIQNSIIFGVNYNLSKHIKNQWITGYTTGIAVSFISCPMELYKIRSQTSKKVPNWKYLKFGFTPTLLRESLYYSIYFGSFSYLQKKTDNVFLSGGLAGILGWIPTYPLDTIKTRIQNGSCNTYSDAIKSRKLWNGFSICCLRGFSINSTGFWIYYKSLDIIKDNI